jgi:hypothetical protein
MRQAATFLKFAQSTNDPKLAAFLVEKAADSKSFPNVSSILKRMAVPASVAFSP